MALTTKYQHIMKLIMYNTAIKVSGFPSFHSLFPFRYEFLFYFTELCTLPIDSIHKVM